MDYKFGDKCEFCAKVFKEKAGRTAKENHYRNCAENPENKQDPELPEEKPEGEQETKERKPKIVVRYKCPECREDVLKEGDNYCSRCGTEIKWEN